MLSLKLILFLCQVGRYLEAVEVAFHLAHVGGKAYLGIDPADEGLILEDEELQVGRL